MDTRAHSIPTWVSPDHQQVRDLLTITKHHRDDYTRGVWDGADWACGWPVSREAAGDEMTDALPERNTDREKAGRADVLAWLMGFAAAPIEIPRRNSDGTVVTAEQLYAEMVDDHPLPPIAEERRDMQDKARRQAARWAALADLS
ncbi:hypothetical protein EV383_4337 [Pseudonocardia sediminis]|uniref:Uncharacterized protein n=1 Tax=Pseudonocardia sediminis TaxID=1397368 RepID=A0A4Q7V1R8_PSEST|nr:hypothetical protein [Pseudonocardia sediminis]RZT87414.1 hypothetical protein EV383_4337 [Pseudonocardia sediminis]